MKARSDQPCLFVNILENFGRLFGDARSALNPFRPTIVVGDELAVHDGSMAAFFLIHYMSRRIALGTKAELDLGRFVATYFHWLGDEVGRAALRWIWANKIGSNPDRFVDLAEWRERE